MAIEFKLPELGENIDGGDLVSVLVNEGDQITPNQDVFEIEAGKGVLPVPSAVGGRIVKVHAQKGAHVKVGDVLLTIEPVGAEAKSNGGVPSATSKTAAAKPETVAAPARAETRPSAAPQQPEEADEPEPDGTALPAGPATRRVARELGVDLQRVRGTGPRGRITPDDVTASAAQQPITAAISKPATPAPTAPRAPQGTPADDRYGPIRREPLTQIRRTIAAQMVRSATTIPHVTNFDDADITELERIRKGVRPGQLGANVKLTLLPFVMKSIALALKEQPLVNSSLDEENQQIIYKDYVHLGIAVDTPRGLVVPVLRDVDRMTIPEVARALASIAERSRSAQFSMDDLRGGTFTVSNLGAVGGAYSTPIINHPEAAILLLGRSRLMPVVYDGQIEPRLMLPLSLSYDHRLIDGAEAARFLNRVIERLLSPGQLLLAE